jgi:hypothetical protein
VRFFAVWSTLSRLHQLILLKPTRVREGYCWINQTSSVVN